jgi:hypothetical protein
MDYRKTIRGKPYLNIAWFVIAFLCVAASIWQIQISLAKERAEKNKALPPPPKTRYFARDVDRIEPVPDYATRKKQGLEDREIGWILEDFLFAGLDQGIRAATPEDYLRQRKQQDRWYRDLMVEAWSLAPEQAARMTRKLEEIFKQSEDEFRKSLNEGNAAFKKEGQWYRIVSSQPIHRLIDFRTRLPEMPKPDSAESATTQSPDGDLEIINSFLPPVSETPAIPLPKTGSKLLFLHSLHPAQFKLMLLLDPALAGEIRKELDAPPPRE